MRDPQNHQGPTPQHEHRSLNAFIQTETIFQILWACTLVMVLIGMLTAVNLIPSWVHRHDKIAHFVAFGVLAGMAHGAWPGTALLALWGGITFLGLLTEAAQHLTATRRFCWRDALANALGAGSVLLTVSLWAN